MYLFVYTPIKKETSPHSVWFTFPCGLFSLKSSISTKSTTRKRAKPPLKTTKNTSFFYRGIFSTFLVLFSGRALGHYARAREELRVLVNPIASTCQPNCEYLSKKTEKCDYLNAIFFSIYSQFIILAPCARICTKCKSICIRCKLIPPFADGLSV